MSVARRLYLSAYGRDCIAGPVLVLAIAFSQPIRSAAIQKAASKKRYISTNLEATGNLLDEIEEDRDYFTVFERISVTDIERKGYNYTVSEAGLRLTHQLAVRQMLDYQTVWVSHGSQVVGNLYSTFHVDRENPTETFYADLLAKFHHNWWMRNYYHSHAPEYGWAENFGYKSERHLNTLLYRGPSFDYHRPSMLLSVLPKHWLRLVQNNDFWALCQPWLTNPPRWWRRLYGNVHFCHGLSNREMTELHQTFSRIYSREFRSWLKKEWLSLGLPESELENVLRVRLDVKDVSHRVGPEVLQKI